MDGGIFIDMGGSCFSLPTLPLWHTVREMLFFICSPLSMKENPIFFSQIHELAEFFYLYLPFFSSSINYFNSPSRQIFNLSHFFLSIHNKPSCTRGKTQLKHSTCERKKNTKRPKVHLGMTIPACHVPDVRRFDCLTLSSSKLHLRPMMPVTPVT